ncbi:tetratricopeptide repeat protein [Thermaurantiacus sp.]
MTRFAALLLLAGAAQAQDRSSADPEMAALYAGCVNAIASNPQPSEEFARAWAAERNGGVPARQCLGLALVAQKKYADAARAFVDAAKLAEQLRNPLVADLWGQAGNALLLAGDAAAAIGHLTSAIAATGEHAPLLSSGFHLDRARAAVEAGELALARRDLDRATSLNPEDPHALMLSAALARREGDLGRAQRDIAAASARAPSDPDVMFEQGNIAAASGDLATARRVWEMVTRAAPSSDAARLARARLGS